MENEQALVLDMVRQADLLFLRLQGVIDEDNRLAERMPNVAGLKVLINLGGVQRINSCGVRDWVRWVQALETQDNELYFVQCSPPIVTNLNLVRNFCGNHGQVLSFLAPYLCTTCEKEYRQPVTLSGNGPITEAPAMACPSCGEMLEFDDLPEAYFDFTRNHGSLPVDPDVAAALHKFADAHLATKVAMLKELSSGTVTPIINTQAGMAVPDYEPSDGSTAPSPGRAAADTSREDAPTRRVGPGPGEPAE